MGKIGLLITGEAVTGRGLPNVAANNLPSNDIIAYLPRNSKAWQRYRIAWSEWQRYSYDQSGEAEVKLSFDTRRRGSVKFRSASVEVATGRTAKAKQGSALE